MPNYTLEEVLHPQSIAVVGASNGGRGVGFLTPLIEIGFKGKIYPVNPKYPGTIAGLQSYPSLREIPGPVDYIISVIPASQVLKMMEDCPAKGVKGIHFFTARFSETGRPEAAELEQEILRQARKSGIRIIGPNCMGVYYPGQGLSFNTEFPKESGKVGLASQSGNLALELIRLSALRGIRYSKAISYGNAIDFNESDYLDYLAHDTETEIIMMYVEGVKNGKRFFQTLRQTTLKKPVIIIKGGRNRAGKRATTSHTASLAGSTEIWESMVRQAGAIPARDFDEVIDIATAFYFLPPVNNRRVGVAGAAGGPSVIAADVCEDAGLEVIPLPQEIREKLKSQGNPVWDWLSNPADRSIGNDFDISSGSILQLMAEDPHFDLLIAIVGESWGRSQEEPSPENHLKLFLPKDSHLKPVLAVVPEKSLGIDQFNNPAWKLMCGCRTKLIADKIPFFPTVSRAANAASKLISYYTKRPDMV